MTDMSHMTITELSELFNMTSFNIQTFINKNDIQPSRVHINEDGSQTRYYRIGDFRCLNN